MNEIVRKEVRKQIVSISLLTSSFFIGNFKHISSDNISIKTITKGDHFTKKKLIQGNTKTSLK